MTQAAEAAQVSMTPTAAPHSGAAAARRRSWRLPVFMLVALAVVAAVSAYLTAPRSGDRMDPDGTSPESAHALVTLLRDAGVEVVTANSVADVEHAARPDTQILIAQSQFLTDHAVLNRLAAVPGDLLLVEPTSRTREALAPGLRLNGTSELNSEPNCNLREANRAGAVQFGPSEAYRPTGGLALTSCYDGVLVRFHDGGRSVTVVGNTDFMTNGGLLDEGNAALAMNLAGAKPRLIWFTPHRAEGENAAATSILDLIPDNVTWIVWQLWLTVLVVALWKGRRIGPLVAEQLPVVVRASETVEGRGRLYRSRRARDRAAAALRTATLQRLLPRLGLGSGAAPSTVVNTLAERAGVDPGFVGHQLFGPTPGTDNDLLQLARALDNIERQVTHS